MKVTITGSLGNISKPLAQKLVQAGHQVTVITSKADKVAAIEALGAKAAVGSVDDVNFLTEAFKDAEAVYTMVPPNFAASNYREYMKNIGIKYAEALQKAGIKRVVNLSSIGADLPDGTGPIKGLYEVEHIFNALSGIAITHLRPASFYTNFYSNVDLIKNLGFMGANYGADLPLVLVHPADIADAAFEELQKTSPSSGIRYIASDIKTGGEVAQLLGNAIGKPELKWVEFTDAQSLEGMLQAGLPQEIAHNFVEMGAGYRGGQLVADFFRNQPALSARKLESFAPEFAQAF